MDERTQYVPSFTYTYPASETTIGINQETIAREASDKDTEYKNVEDVPIESVAASVNKERLRKLYENL